MGERFTAAPLRHSAQPSIAQLASSLDVSVKRTKQTHSRKNKINVNYVE